MSQRSFCDIVLAPPTNIVESFTIRLCRAREIVIRKGLIAIRRPLTSKLNRTDAPGTRDHFAR